MTIALVHFNHQDRETLTTWPDMRTSSWKPNYGDMLVCASVLRELELEETVRVGFGGTLTAPVSRAIVRGSTYLHGNFNFEAANKTLDSIDAPLAIVGLGAQNPTQDAEFLDNNEQARDFIARLNEKSASISVRGEFTAEVVKRLGGENIRITGCPSLFYLGKPPQVSPSETLLRPERAIGISIHSDLRRNIFCHAPEKAKLRHGQAFIWALTQAETVSVFEQGVLQEYDVADRALPYETRYSAAQKVIERIKVKDLVPVEWLLAHMVSVKSIEEWLAKTRDLDAVIGFRFHGNMVGLLQGRPCYYYVYDSRLTEFCDLYGLPYQDVTEEWTDPVKVMAEHDWDRANSRMASCFQELRNFYAENGFTDTFAD